MLNWTVFVVLGMTVFNHADGEYPGARLILTSKALDYVSSLIIPALEKELSELKIVDTSDDTEIPLIGTIHYAISNIHIDVPSMKSSTISSSTNGITLQLSNIAFSAMCDWKCEMEYWPHFGDHGGIDIKIRDAAIQLHFLITKSADGHPVILSTECDVILPSLSVDLCGSTSWLTWTYGWFQNMIEDELKEALNLKLCDYIINSTTEWNSVLSSYPLSKEFNNFTITYGLLRDPAFSSDQIQFDLEGQVLAAMNDSLSQSVAHVLPSIDSTDNMVHLLLTNKFFATVITAAIHSGQLNYKVTPDQLPSTSPLKLSTEFFKHIVPNLFKEFPNSAIAIAVDINEYKEVYLDLAGIHVSMLGTLLVQVIQRDETTLDAFSVELELYCTLEADILQLNDKPAILFEATDFQTTLGRLKSSFGDFETAALKRALNGISLPLMFVINEYGRKGFAVPHMDKLNLIHSSITLKKDYIQVNTDFEYLLDKI